MLASLLGAAFCLLAGTIWAAEPTRVLVMAPPQSRLERLLAAEVGNLGLQALIHSQTDGAAPPSGEMLASTGASAAVRVTESGRAIEIWIAERDTGRAVLRDSVAGLGESNDEDLAVLRAGELLRANLIEIERPQAAPPQPEIATPPEAAKPKPAARWVVSAGPSLLLGEHGLSAQPGVMAGLGVAPRSSYALELWAAWSATDSAKATAGSATISPRHLGLGVVRLFLAGAKWHLAAGGAAALQWLHVQGRAQPGFAASSDDHVTAALLGRGQLAYSPLERFHLALDLQAGATWQRTRIRLAGEDVATWGRGLVLTSLRAEVLW